MESDPRRAVEVLESAFRVTGATTEAVKEALSRTTRRLHHLACGVSPEFARDNLHDTGDRGIRALALALAGRTAESAHYSLSWHR